MTGSPSRTDAQEVDRALVRRIARGDESAMTALFDRYGGPQFAFAHRILADPAEAEEAVLEAFMQAWSDASRFDASRGSVGAWLTMMVRSRALDRVRARTRRERATASSVNGSSAGPPGMGTRPADPDRALQEEEHRRQVIAALVSLPAEQREAIELAFYEGLSQSEIAARLALPLGTVKTRVRSGMLKLRELLRELVAEGTP